MPWISGNRYLSLQETYNNAGLIAPILLGYGWSRTAAAACLGNMRAESGCNPGIWESLTPYAGGYGLVQWTPYTKYSEWYGNGWEDNGPGECDRINYESLNNIQWFRNEEFSMDPPVTFQQYRVNDNLPLNDMSDYWMLFYEHPADPYGQIDIRRQYSQDMYDRFLSPTQLPIWLLMKISNDNTRRWLKL